MLSGFSNHSLPWMVRFQRIWRYYYLSFLRSQSSSHELARGMAMGVFAGMLPLFGLQIIIAMALAFVVRGNKPMAALTTWVSNPLTYAPIYWFNFQVGWWIVGKPALDIHTVDSWRDALTQGGLAASILMLGSLWMAVILSALTYGIGLRLIPYLKQRLKVRRRSKQSQIRDWLKR
ncbi:DUF2062 domain-containing protein [Candidatus Synechococcus calcipolaris G9]|uniref:DUF2062 domain-containing protein n=1 Tax=Candidatus Synechococcus calcipolaris G9 TaxID=1497997 RepID=A0ABT6EYM5_9SYNE|nr:DUF2062 domain-containing protein [Candidatus Synechococcus calcipolaris]MDG2990857.1 DUF2062 domain-containing protein [Candidatus Synechococcus calcipolaris G9]